jgi:hypothetical protein
MDARLPARFQGLHVGRPSFFSRISLRSGVNERSCSNGTKTGSGLGDLLLVWPRLGLGDAMGTGEDSLGWASAAYAEGSE